MSLRFLPRYFSLDCLTRDSRRAVAIITNSLSREFPRKRPQPDFNGSIRMFRQHDVWANGRAVPLPKFSSGPRSHGRRVIPTSTRQNLRVCLVFRRTSSQMTGTCRSHAWMQRQLPSRDTANSSLTVQNIMKERAKECARDMIRKTIDVNIHISSTFRLWSDDTRLEKIKHEKISLTFEQLKITQFLGHYLNQEVFQLFR